MFDLFLISLNAHSTVTVFKIYFYSRITFAGVGCYLVDDSPYMGFNHRVINHIEGKANVV